jgi:glycosyltransferase involved in cell wall biosynthesis
MPERVKVLHLVSQSVRWPYLRSIVDFSDRNRFELTVASLEPPGPLQEDIAAAGVSTFSLNCQRRSQYPTTIWRLARWLRRERTDVIQVHLFEASLVGLAAAKLAGVPLRIFTGHHSHEIPLHSKRRLLWLDKVCSCWLSHRIIALSVDMQRFFVQTEGVPAKKVVVIPLGFDLSRWHTTEAESRRVRKELGLDHKTILGAVGRLYWVKDYPCLLEAFAGLAPQHPDVVLLVVGQGPERENLIRKVRELGLENKVVFAGLRSDIVAVMGAIDALVHPAIAESFGQVIVEAYALGKPVVSTCVGVAPELIEDGVNGYTVPTRDATAMRAALEKLLAERSRWVAMGCDGQRRVAQFASQLIVPRCEAQYLSWLAERTGATPAAEPVSHQEVQGAVRREQQSGEQWV